MYKRREPRKSLKSYITSKDIDFTPDDAPEDDRSIHLGDRINLNERSNEKLMTGLTAL